MSEKKRLIADLRVIDLRQELEKRKLDKSGVRAVLLKRLSQFLRDEGHDPEAYTFDPMITETKPKRGRSGSLAEAEAEAEVETDADAEDTLLDVRVEDMIVQDDVGDEDDLEDEKKETPSSLENMLVKPEDVDTNTAVEPVSRKRELKDAPEATTAKKPCLDLPTDKAEISGEDVKSTELNIADTEDSINLDIGEDELLNDDADSSAKIKKAEAAVGDGATQLATPTTDVTAPSCEAVSKHDEHREVKSDGNTTSEKDDIKDKDEIDEKTDTEGTKTKEEGKEAVAANMQARNLWVCGLSGDTRAKDLKQLFSKHGKVIGAKVVTNARTPGSRCYGYVTMSSAQDAENCIKNLHLTELHGRMISVEKARSENTSTAGPAAARRPATSRRSDRRDPHRHPSDEKSKDGKNENGEATKESSENGDGKKEEDASEGKARSTSRSRDKRSSDKGAGDKLRRDKTREKKRSPKEVLSFNKIWKERDAARARERSRAAREEERRRRAAEEALRERERRQRQEKHRLALEREKLRTERERIEREKNELLRLERERHKLEREKLELERLELKRAQLRLEEERRKRGSEYVSGYRKPSSPPPPPPYERDARHKRPPPPPLSSSRSNFEAPPPPRFEMVAPAYERSGDKRERGDYKRDYNPRHLSTSSVKYASNGTSTDDSRQPIPPGTRPKEPVGRAGYEARESRSAAYRSSPPSKPEPRPWSTSTRYPDSSAPTKEYSERGGSGSSAWTGSSASKSYSSSRHAPTSAAASQSWSKPGSSSNASETWQSSSGGGGGGESRYGSNYEARSYPAAYQPPPPGAAPYVDRYQAPTRGDYRQKY